MPDARHNPMSPQLIETIRVDSQGRIPLLERHLARLTASSSALGYVCVAAQVRNAIQAVRAQLPQNTEHRLRLLLERHGSLAITTTPLPVLSAAPRITLSAQRLPADTLWLRHKTTHRPWFDAASEWLAQHPDYFDLIFLNEQGHLCEGSRSNVYLLLDNEWCTPPADCGLLPGVQRAEILANGLAVERTLTVQDLHRTQGIRLSNALRGWFDVAWADLLAGDKT